MQRQHLTPLADAMLNAYFATLGYSRWFTDIHGQPPSKMAKTQNLLSVVQSELNLDPRFELSDRYAEYGRVEVSDRRDGISYVLRSEAMLAIERQREALFDSNQYLASDTLLLVHRFHQNGLDLSIAAARKKAGKLRLQASGPAIFVGAWPFVAVTPPPTKGIGFDQGAEDAFGELGDIGDAGEAGES